MLAWKNDSEITPIHGRTQLCGTTNPLSQKEKLKMTLEIPTERLLAQEHTNQLL